MASRASVAGGAWEPALGPAREDGRLVAESGEPATMAKLTGLPDALHPELGTFEALETLALGILGKLALWRALAVVAATDARLRGIDFDSLAARAQAQHARVEERRIEAALTAFKAAPG